MRDIFRENRVVGFRLKRLHSFVPNLDNLGVDLCGFLEKQKEGKKRLRQFGKGDVPQEAFTPG